MLAGDRTRIAYRYKEKLHRFLRLGKCGHEQKQEDVLQSWKDIVEAAIPCVRSMAANDLQGYKQQAASLVHSCVYLFFLFF